MSGPNSFSPGNDGTGYLLDELEILLVEYDRDNSDWEFRKGVMLGIVNRLIAALTALPAQAHANPPALKAAIEGVTVDPGDGCTVIPLEYVLIRGFSAMGWKLPATAAGDMLEAVAAAVAKEAIRHISPMSSTERAYPDPADRWEGWPDPPPSTARGSDV